MDSPKKVLIVDCEEDDRYAEMFRKRNYDVDILMPGDVMPDKTVHDLVVFEGGPDVNPALYGVENVASTIDEARDRFEILVYEHFYIDTPKVGICRGGQLLNVLNGGKMVQHIEGHQGTIHGIFGYRPASREVWVTEVMGDHHQAMVVSQTQGYVVAFATSGSVAEVIWYPSTKSLCFQPHPEWGHQKTEDLFFDLVTKLARKDERVYNYDGP